VSGMKELLLGTATAIRQAIHSTPKSQALRLTCHDAPGGDAQFGIDEIAEEAAWHHLRAHHEPLAVYTEDHPLRTTGPRPRTVVVVDPIDGTRPAAAELESSMISIAAAPYTPDVRLGEVHSALLMETRSGAWMYTDPHTRFETHGYQRTLPRLSDTTDPNRMFWSFELNGHPMALMAHAYGHLVDQSANTGGVFIFNSATFSITRILTGQLDAYLDIGNRILRDNPTTEPDFRACGRGHVLHLFPYDIAAAVTLATRAGAVVTDGYGRDLAETRLLDGGESNQQSCIAAANPALHKTLLDLIHWPGPATIFSPGDF